MASPVASLVAELETCADAEAASRHLHELAAHITQDDAAEAFLCEPAHARSALNAVAHVLGELSGELDAEALAGGCIAISVALEGALEEAPDSDALLMAASRGVCAACRCGGKDALHETAGAVALLASVGTPALREALRAEAAPHVVAAMLDGGLDSAACVALHYLTQDGGAATVARLPGVGAALSAALFAAADDEDCGEEARAAAAAAALVHIAADSECAALLAPAAAAAVAALEQHASSAAVVRMLAAAVAKLADAGAADARTPAACAAAARALALHRGAPALRTLLLAALVAAAAAEEQAAALLSGAAPAPFALETRASGIAGAGAGLFVASGEVPAGSVVALYPGEVWTAAPPASVAAGNEYLAASPNGGYADGSAAAVARAAADATARGAPELGARAAAHMANHPAAGAAPNCIFLELALHRDALLRAPAAAPGGGAPPWVLCLLSVEALPSGTEVTVDYRIDPERAPAWFVPVPEHLALL